MFALLLAALLAATHSQTPSQTPLERMATAMLPAEKMHNIAGFFGPVAKKYKPVFERFGAEYQSAPEKLKIVAKYLPDAEKALAMARQMRVPAKYEKEKAEYIRIVEALLYSAKLAVKIGT